VLFLIPFMVVILLYGAPYVQRSWRIYEGSANIGGMPGLFVLKTFIPIFAILVLLQGIAWAFRSLVVLAGREQLLPEHLRYKRHAEMPEAVL
jgi:TRAP-type mannitol/chloroaromatic compound transport system permease small subunit